MEKTKETHVTVVRSQEARSITLPVGMEYDEGIKWLKRQRDQEETEIELSETVDGHPYDVAYCLGLAVDEVFGFRQSLRTPGFFGSTPPRIISIPCDEKGNTVDLMIGQFSLPGIEGTLGLYPDGSKAAVISATIKQKSKGKVHELVTVTRRIMKEKSLYRGKAIRVYTDATDGNMEKAPEFMELTFGPEDLILDSDVLADVNAAVWVPIKFRKDLSAEEKKRGVLVEGKYGTGKTLFAHVTAKMAVDNGWTFIYGKNMGSLQHDYETARMMAPAVLFVEDLDKELEAGNLNRIQNTLDGIDNKTAEVIIIFTTNFVEKIPQVMLRPGRLDFVVSFRPPDVEATKSLILKYGGGLLEGDLDLSRAADAVKGNIPAAIKEIVRRAKFYAIGRMGGTNVRIDAQDLEHSAYRMKAHLDRLKEEVPKKINPVEAGFDVIGKHIVLGLERVMSNMPQLTRHEEVIISETLKKLEGMNAAEV